MLVESLPIEETSHGRSLSFIDRGLLSGLSLQISLCRSPPLGPPKPVERQTKTAKDPHLLLSLEFLLICRIVDPKS